MTVEMWMGLGIVVAIIGFIMWRVGLCRQREIETQVWLL